MQAVGQMLCAILHYPGFSPTPTPSPCLTRRAAARAAPWTVRLPALPSPLVSLNAPSLN